MPEWLTTLLWIGLGSGLGGMARHGLNLFLTARLGETFPWGILIVNILGSLLIGIFAALSVPDGKLSPRASLFFMVGLCGGFTTFSAFSIQTLHLMRDNAFGAAFANVLASVLLCLGATWIGYAATHALNR